MAVPARDRRDCESAQGFDLPIVQVIAPAEGEAELPYESKSATDRLVNSAQFDGMPAPEAQRAIVAWLDERGRGKPAVSFRLRAWGWSRQRHRGRRVPIGFCDET